MNISNDTVFLNVKKLFNILEVDKAVFFGLLSKMWSFGAGPITAILIAFKFTPQLQGYYYTFGTLLSLQVFVELGLGTVIIQFASHEWSKLSLTNKGEINGNSDALIRLGNLFMIGIKWYLIGALILFLGLSFGGIYFFTTSQNDSVKWVLPWLSLCLFTGLSISIVPIWSILEGCNQVSKLYTYRFFQGLITSISMWVALFFGAELWTTSVSGIMTLIFGGIFIRQKYWNFFKSLIRNSIDGEQLTWRKDVLPMQWRIAVSWISGFLAFGIFTPVLFKYQGSVIAGQMGMTWTVIGVISALSAAWISPKVPRFGILIAQKKYIELDSFFWKVTKISITVSVIAGVIIGVIVYLLNYFNNPLTQRFASRMLLPLPLSIFILAQIISTLSTPFSAYLRAHKKEPLMVISLIYGVLIGLSTFILGRYSSVLAVAIGYLVCNILIIPFIFLIWHRYSIIWHTKTDSK